MKSKAEIVVETLRHYNLKNRGYNRAEGHCTYLDKASGNKCAVGRCILDSELEKVSVYEQEQFNQNDGSPSVVKLVENFNDIDYLLSPDYRGHDVEFWKNLQNLHDSTYNWDEYGITQRGLESVDSLFGEDADVEVKKALAR